MQQQIDVGRAALVAEGIQRIASDEQAIHTVFSQRGEQGSEVIHARRPGRRVRIFVRLAHREVRMRAALAATTRTSASCTCRSASSCEAKRQTPFAMPVLQTEANAAPER